MKEEYLRHLKEKGYSQATIQAYRSVFSHFRQELNKHSIEWFHKKVLDFAGATRFCYLTRLKRYLKYARPELVKYVIIPAVTKRLPRDIPSQTEFKKVLQRPDILSFKGIRDRALMELLYSTGIRRQELINLKLGDIDHRKLLVQINEGKMKKDRIVPVSRKAHQWLARYLVKVRPMLKPKTNHIFVSMYGKKLSKEVPYKVIKSYAEYSCHMYRHAYATHLVQNGMNIASLQRLLGHSRLTTTQVYTQVTLNELEYSYRKYHQRDRWKDV